MGPFTMMRNLLPAAAKDRPGNTAAAKQLLWEVDKNASPKKVIAISKKFLRRTGWIILPPWDWIDVMIRAQKATCYINLKVYEPASLSWRTSIRDAAEDGSMVNSRIGLITAQSLPDEARTAASDAGTYALTVSELWRVEELETAVALAVETRRQKALSLE